MHAFGKAKGSAAYNQTANTSLISIINMASYQVIPSVRPFLIKKRIPGGDQSECLDLPDSSLSESGGLSKWDSLEPLYVGA